MQFVVNWEDLTTSHAVNWEELASHAGGIQLEGSQLGEAGRITRQLAMVREGHSPVCSKECSKK